ncbi:hypothetical protein D3C87_1493690 [compost metagenome]
MRLGSRVLSTLEPNLMEHYGIARPGFYQLYLDAISAQSAKLLIEACDVRVGDDC